jgi:HTH-type transcriptional regulator/antitoxin HigA
MEGAAMNTTTTLIFAEMPKDYPGLVMNFMPKAIHDNVDYENTLEVIDTLVGHELTDEQELYLDTLSTLVDAYENEHYAMETHGMSPVEALKFLMEQHDMTADDIGRLLGERTLGSKILRRKRKIGLKYARTLAKKFAVDVSVFIR